MNSRIPGSRAGGVLLITALIIAGVMMLWAIAATARANFQTGATHFGYRKSEVYYLAKAATSRALNQVNTVPGWIAAHDSLANADSSLAPGTLCWVETAGSTQTLRCQASVGSTKTTLNVPIMQQSSSDTHLYSITHAQGGGPDVIAWTTTSSTSWDSLPPIPGMQRVLATAQTPNGDVFALASNPPSTDTGVWRYRTGQGWLELPNPPTGVALSTLSAGGDDRLVCRGSNNAVMVLPLGTDMTVAMEWKTVSAPSGISLTNAAAHPKGQPQVYTTAVDGSGQAVVHSCNITNLYTSTSNPANWTRLSDPAPVAFDPTTGAPVAPPATISNYDGGLTVDKNGSVFAASNPPASASVVYTYQAGAWTPLKPIPALNWNGLGVLVGTANGNNLYGQGYATNISNLQADDKDTLWAQWTQPGSNDYSLISMPNSP